MLTVFIKRGNGEILRDNTVQAIKDAMGDPGATFWVDMLTPSKEETDLLRSVFAFHELAVEDAIQLAQRSKLERFPPDKHHPAGFFYMVFHGPDLDTFRQNLRTKEVDMFATERALVTIHDQPMRSIQHVIDRASADASLALGNGVDALLYLILDQMTDHYQPILEYLEESFNDLEDRALTDPKPGVLNEIATRKRELLNLRRLIGPQREVVAQLTRGEVPFIREQTRFYLRDVQDHLVRIVEMIELYRDLILGSRDIYLSSVSNNLNQIMKTLTIISVIGLPATIVTGFFGMNFDEPWMHDHRVFLAALIGMACLVTGMLFLFKKKRWI